MIKQAMIRTGMAGIVALALQGCASSEEEAAVKAEASEKTAETHVSCDTVFHCPADPQDIRICRDQQQLEVIWQTPGIEAYRLAGSLGETFTAQYSQRFQVIENTLSWQHMGIRYTAYHYLDESRPETLEAIGVTLETQGRSRTISCNDNAVSNLARLHQATSAGESAPSAK
ncbi:hypothetical protein ACFOZ5_02335 [Marinobacter lacisalsi]|uniref:Lipoprotein n=1 Tax=Marinobacter lacisalsi TaxID=475979 RepID=A0ABV8QFL4_9GAMM